MVEQIQVPSADDPATALAAVVALRRLAERLERAAVAEAIRQGWTWAQIAEALGVTRQAAHKRHAGRLLEAEITKGSGR
jgi:DNA-binding NarL/FixJ family response regulator